MVALLVEHNVALHHGGFIANHAVIELFGLAIIIGRCFLTVEGDIRTRKGRSKNAGKTVHQESLAGRRGGSVRKKAGMVPDFVILHRGDFDVCAKLGQLESLQPSVHKLAMLVQVDEVFRKIPASVILANDFGIQNQVAWKTAVQGIVARLIGFWIGVVTREIEGRMRMAMPSDSRNEEWIPRVLHLRSLMLNDRASTVFHQLYARRRKRHRERRDRDHRGNRSAGGAFVVW